MELRHTQRWFPAGWGGLFAVSLLAAPLGWAAEAVTADEIFPLSEVRTGQSGVWRTVVMGNEIREFELRILGVVDNFAGPKHPVILAEALDAENILSGPVAGMSGSPVYIDERIVGAYAYGYVWPKEQAVIGITPIEQMLEIFTLPESPRGSRPAAALTMAQASSGAESPGSPRLQAVPSPLMFGGFSERTVAVFRDRLEALGFVASSSPIGGAEGISLDLRPGAPIAGVLMRGDFSAAATGTITWTDGQRLLAFGHPFLQAGAVELPLAGADIITVVRNLRSSFKLANIGPPEGRLFQDRLTGIAGERGEVPPMTSLGLSLQPVPGETVEFSAEIWPHPQFLPLLTAMAVLEATGQTLYREDEQTLRLEGTLTLADGTVLPLSSRAAGPSAGQQLAVELFLRLGNLVNNPYEPLKVGAVKIAVAAEAGVHAAVLRQVELGDARPRPGRSFPLTLRILNYRGVSENLTLEVPLAAGFLPGQKLQLLVTDAAGANRFVNASRRSSNKLTDVLAEWREVRSEGFIYVFLLDDEAVPEVEGQSLPGLPPSIRATLSSSATDFVVAPGARRVHWEGRLPVAGVFSGQDTVTLTLY
jgi:hypothetical protein